MIVSPLTIDHPLDAQDKALAKRVLETLQKHYPAVAKGWLVKVDGVGGVVTVQNLFLSGKMGFMLHTAKLDPEMKAVMRAGGELLERYRVARSHALDIRETLANSERNWKGEVAYDS